MKAYLFPALLCLAACSQAPKEEAVKQAKVSSPTPQTEPKEEATPSPPAAEKAQPRYAKLDSAARQNLAGLDTLYASVPFYTRPEKELFFITSNGNPEYPNNNFKAGMKYGLALNSKTVLLAPKYDKIGNPNLVLKHCFELKAENKFGLINYKTGQLLTPRFDFILPASAEVSDIAYGYQDSLWYRIESSSLKVSKAKDFDPLPFLKAYLFNLNTLGDCLLFNNELRYKPDGLQFPRGVALAPSYAEYLKLWNEDFYTEIILKNDEFNSDIGISSSSSKVNEARSLPNSIVAFFTSVYEEGVGGRGYAIEKKNLIVYNSHANRFAKSAIGMEEYGYGYQCENPVYDFVNDSILEVKSMNANYEKGNQLYNFETSYAYYKINPTGAIEELKTKRHFPYTKFIIIDESYFTGCFADYMQETELNEYDNFNIWETDHLSIKDLDIMRNEIFAEYGYTFQSEEWQDYFGRKKWYTPLYDDVTDQLTEIDKANIQTILKMRKQMEGRESEFVKRNKGTYHAAG